MNYLQLHRKDCEKQALQQRLVIVIKN